MKHLNLYALWIIMCVMGQMEGKMPPATRADTQMIERDEIDDTDTLAIPLDSSELEDEEQINWGEQRPVFPGLNSPSKK